MIVIRRNASAPFTYHDRCSPSPIRCYSGVRSLCLVSPAGLAGGAFVDTPVKEGWLYVLKARVYHEDPFVLIGSKSSNIPEEAAATCGARLVLWDKQDGKVISEPATKSGEWEVTMFLFYFAFVDDFATPCTMFTGTYA